MHRKSFIAALAAGSLMGLASLAQAAPAVVAGTGHGPVPHHPSAAPVHTAPGQIVIMQTPPAPLYEAVPAARAGYIWAPGHYVWDNGRYMWRSGQWLETRSGYAWRPAQWQQRADGSWQLVGGTWVRTDNLAYDRSERRGPDGDRDRDGIRNADDNDRDGDGVANWRDNFPNDPSRM